MPPNFFSPSPFLDLEISRHVCKFGRNSTNLATSDKSLFLAKPPSLLLACCYSKYYSILFFFCLIPLSSLCHNFHWRDSKIVSIRELFLLPQLLSTSRARTTLVNSLLLMSEFVLNAMRCTVFELFPSFCVGYLTVSSCKNVTLAFNESDLLWPLRLYLKAWGGLEVVFSIDQVVLIKNIILATFSRKNKRNCTFFDCPSISQRTHNSTIYFLFSHYKARIINHNNK